MLNRENPSHVAAEARLRTETVIWLTTVNADGQPQTSPVWFLWDGGQFLIFGSKNGPKTPNIRANPKVSLHLDGNGTGGDIVIFEGTAVVDADGPPSSAFEAYVAKYGGLVEAYRWTMEKLAEDYPHVIRVTPTRARIW